MKKDPIGERLAFYRQFELLTTTYGLSRRKDIPSSIDRKATNIADKAIVEAFQGVELQVVYVAPSYCRTTRNAIWLWHKMERGKDLFIVDIQDDWNEKETFFAYLRPSLKKMCPSIKVLPIYWVGNQPVLIK